MYKLNHMFVAAAAALTLTGCLKSEGDDLFKKLEPVRPGIAIYNAAHPQNMLSMQSADAALRLAMLMVRLQYRAGEDSGRFPHHLQRQQGQLRRLQP